MAWAYVVSGSAKVLIVHFSQVLEKFAINVPPYGIARSADEAYEHARRIGKCCDDFSWHLYRLH